MNDNGWTGIRRWLRTSDSDWFHDECVLGSLAKYEAEELLLDYGIEVSRDNLRRLGREVNESLLGGR